MVKKLPALCIALLTLSGTFACDEGGEALSTVGLKLVAPGGAPDPFEGVSWITVRAESDGLSSPIQETVSYRANGQAELPLVPYPASSEHVSLIVEGRASDSQGQPGKRLARGRIDNLSPRANKDLQHTLLFARTNSITSLFAKTTTQSQRLAHGRVGHGVAITQDEIVITGGGSPHSQSARWWQGGGLQDLLTSVEIVDRQTYEVRERQPMTTARAWHTAVALQTGQVVIMGGYGPNGDPMRSAELYNPPSIPEFSGAPAQLKGLAVPRAGHTATLIDPATHTILVVGGDIDGTWELWDPKSGSSGAHPLPSQVASFHHQATAYPGGPNAEPHVLITGGEGSGQSHKGAMLYLSDKNVFRALPNAMPGGRRTQHAAVYVPERDFIYIIGGFTDTDHTQSNNSIDTYLIDPQTRDAHFDARRGLRLGFARGAHEATLLPENTVAIFGGASPENQLLPTSNEMIYEELSSDGRSIHVNVTNSDQNDTIPRLPTGRTGHRIITQDGMALIIGGFSVDHDTLTLERDLLLYHPQ